MPGSSDRRRSRRRSRSSSSSSSDKSSEEERPRGRRRYRSRSPRRRKYRRSPGQVVQGIDNLRIEGTGAAAEEGGGEVLEERPGVGLDQSAPAAAEGQRYLIKTLLKKHRDTIAELLAEQKQDLYDKVEESSSKKHNFRQKNIEKQWEVNDRFEKIAKRAESALKKGRIEKAKSCIEELVDGLEEHSEDLIGADISRHGWLSVARVRNRTSLPKDFLKELERVDTSLDKTKSNTQPPKYGKYSGRNPNVDGATQRDSYVRTNRPPFKKQSPEQLLEEATKQTRAGQCGHCQQEGHFYRECPDFWEKVKESRKANLKK